MNSEMTAANREMPGKGLNINTLKYIAIIAMAIDHVAYAFVPDGTWLAIVMHFIGRITGPVMFYSAVEGYHHTKNINRYIARLAVFAVISWFPFVYFAYGGDWASMNFMHFNVIYTILMGVLAIRVRREMKNPVVKTILVVCLILVTLPADWATLGVIMILVFDYYYGNFKNQAFGYCIVVLLGGSVLSLLSLPFYGLLYGMEILPEYYLYSLQNIGMFLPIALLRFYNGQKGAGGTFAKWFFYVFYPLHLLLLGFLQTVL